MKKQMEFGPLRSIVILVLLAILSPDSNASSKSLPIDSSSNQKKIFWFEGQVQHWAFQAEDEFAVLAQPGKQMQVDTRSLGGTFQAGAVVKSQKSGVIVYRLVEDMDQRSLMSHVRALENPENVKSISPVFYTSTAKVDTARLILTGEVIVRLPAGFSAEQIADMEKTHDLDRIKALPYAPNTYLYRAADALASLEIANRIHLDGSALYAYPNWLRTRAKKLIPNDTLFTDQWHLNNTGQGGGSAGADINITTVWDTYTGSSNEVIAIVDDGLETAHEDLIANVLAGMGYDFTDRDSDPTPTGSDNHGTACAGVAAARGDNTMGVSGAAPSAGLVGIRLLGRGTDTNEAHAFTYRGDVVDIYSNSWGPYDTILISGPGPLTRDALAYGVTSGRNGLGSIYTFAAGNGGSIGDDSNTDGYANSRYTIAVAASTDGGVQAGYSETGANIMVNAPSNGGASGITTADRMGAFGYEDPPGNYTESFGGTSSATPLVSGVIALMLQANPDLTWRDVQHILMTTAFQNDPVDIDWTTNAAGHNINHKYGFGRVDAQAAVTAAETWTSAGLELTTPQVTSNPNLYIPDNDPVGITDTVSVPYAINIESVEVCFSSMDHTWWTDLDILLTAPSGTQSRLARTKDTRGDSRDRFLNWCFNSLRHFGEEGQGDWSLQVSDRYPADTGTFQSWSIRIFGTPTSVNQINASTGAGGTILPVGTVTVGQGWDQDFTISPDSGYEVADVTVDGVSVGAMSAYTFSSVAADHTIAVSFAQSSGGGDGGGSSGCFIQTAAQTADCDHKQ